MLFTTRTLTGHDLAPMKALLHLFGEVFDERETYQGAVPSDAYLTKHLADGAFIAVAALDEAGAVIGGLVAYELKKFERERSEIYIYDLAVHAHCRRHGIATALIERLKEVARQRSAWVIFVQADLGDEPAKALYEKLSCEMIVAHHYDIMP